MSRPKAVIAVAVLHTAETLFVLAMAITCFALTRSSNLRSQGSVVVRGLLIGGVVLALLAIIYGLGTAGLWRARRWGWWISFCTNAVIIVAVLWDIFVDHDRDPDNWIGIAIFAIPIVFLCLPGVRRFFRRPRPAEITTAA